jgi:D-glycero-alpha-D-manno-heptose-7-phosphate kinase
MIICKTPLRISFFGGGTDFPEFYHENGGAVLGTAIDKYIFHSVMRFPSKLFDYSVRLAYRQVECVTCVDKIKHKPFREILRHFNIEKDIEIGLASDLPSFSGLGSSSSFAVGLINALTAFHGKFIPKQDLAKLAIHIERDILKEAVGCQDQIFAAYGGLNLIEFSTTETFTVTRISLTQSRLHELDNSLLLFYTGLTRLANDIERKKINNLPNIKENLVRIFHIVEKAHTILAGNKPLSDFGSLLDETWREKRLLAPCVSNTTIDDMYTRALAAGALGGKLLGAGGGGFMLFFVPEDRQDAVRKALPDFFEIPFSINAHGSSIVHS